MKRVVPFFDTFDEVPDNAKYLYSRKVEVPSEESEEQKAARIISSNPEAHTMEPTILYWHYYEVDGMDFEDLMVSGFGRKNAGDKIKEFMHHYKLPLK
jgi:hypothetical protein